ncbi:MULTISPECIES: hypothetical protein [Rhodophyticola]|jgi:hypothetical protein|uniref:hypothetical protein n=1 Tax=Rhodophyticola TaxID=2680018 RepID=UPI001B1D0FDC|nr:hypothetical protein [Roseicyclus sp.]MBO6922800.1 hypothetical protein [Roseicyclus sp.]
MKTLVLEPDVTRARAWVARYAAGADNTCHVAISAAQARLMLIGTCYDRLCLRLGHLGGQSHAILAVARACNPECEIVDLARMTRRSVSGPSMGEVLRAEPPQAMRIG